MLASTSQSCVNHRKEHCVWTRRANGEAACGLRSPQQEPVCRKLPGLFISSGWGPAGGTCRQKATATAQWKGAEATLRNVPRRGWSFRPKFPGGFRALSSPQLLALLDSPGPVSKIRRAMASPAPLHLLRVRARCPGEWSWTRLGPTLDPASHSVSHVTQCHPRT